MKVSAVGTILFASLFGFALSVIFEDCGSKIGKFTRVTIRDKHGNSFHRCEESTEGSSFERCEIQNRYAVNLGIEFTLNATEQVKEVKAVCHAKALGMTHEYALSYPDACVHSGLSCPLANGTSQTYIGSLPVHKWWWPLDYDVKFQLKNKNGTDIVCVKIPISIIVVG